jgi:hypothetical protein
MSPGRFSTASAVDPLADFLAGLELGHIFLAHIHLFAGARIASHARRTVLHRKGAEAAQFDAITPRHGIADLIEDGVDDVLDVALEQMRILVGKFLDSSDLIIPPPGALC